MNITIHITEFSPTEGLHSISVEHSVAGIRSFMPINHLTKCKSTASKLAKAYFDNAYEAGYNVIHLSV